MGLAAPPRRSFANAHRRPKIRLSLVVEPFSQGSLPYGAKNKKLPFGSLFCFGTRAGIGCAIASPLRPRSLSLTGVLTSASRPCRTLFPGFFPLLRFKNRKTPYWEFFCFNWYARRDSNPGPTD